MRLFAVCYFDGDGYITAWFNAEKQIKEWMKEADIYISDIQSVREVEFIREINIEEIFLKN